MPIKERLPKERRHQLNADQEQELWLGPTRRGSAFTDAAQAQWAWQSNRDRLMQRYARDGRRPMAWWAFESPIKFPGYDRQQAALCAAGLLTEGERAELLTWWRQEFDKAQAPGFTFCAGPGIFLRGVEATHQHYRWADIPAELVKQWQLAMAA